MSEPQLHQTMDSEDIGHVSGLAPIFWGSLILSSIIYMLWKLSA